MPTYQKTQPATTKPPRPPTRVKRATNETPLHTSQHNEKRVRMHRYPPSARKFNSRPAVIIHNSCRRARPPGRPRTHTQSDSISGNHPRLHHAPAPRPAATRGRCMPTTDTASSPRTQSHPGRQIRRQHTLRECCDGCRINTFPTLQTKFHCTHPKDGACARYE